MTIDRHGGAPAAPAGLPVLSAGSHLAPEDGACLMEYVSVLAGQPFGDEPRCTDPLLATLARLVNDATSDGARDRLGALAPALAAAPGSDAVGAADLVLSTLLRVREAVGSSRRLERALRRARRRLDRATVRARAGRRTPVLDLVHRRGPARHRLTAAVDATAALPRDRRDVVLHHLLASVLDELRQPAASGDRDLHRMS
jgi:hypothetical protein